MQPLGKQNCLLFVAHFNIKMLKYVLTLHDFLIFEPHMTILQLW